MDHNKWLSFTETIEKVDINPCVAVPTQISQAFGRRGYIPVELNLSGTEHLANLVPLGKGNYRLYINGLMLKATGWKVGDRVKIELRLDTNPRIEPMSPALSEALAKRPKTQAIFDNLSPSRQKEINRYLNNLKSPEAINRTITKVIAALEGKTTHMLVR